MYDRELVVEILEQIKVLKEMKSDLLKGQQ